MSQVRWLHEFGITLLWCFMTSRVPVCFFRNSATAFPYNIEWFGLQHFCCLQQYTCYLSANLRLRSEALLFFGRPSSNFFEVEAIAISSLAFLLFHRCLCLRLQRWETHLMCTFGEKSNYWTMVCRKRCWIWHLKSLGTFCLWSNFFEVEPCPLSLVAPFWRGQRIL